MAQRRLAPSGHRLGSMARAGCPSSRAGGNTNLAIRTKTPRFGLTLPSISALYIRYKSEYIEVLALVVLGRGEVQFRALATILRPRKACHADRHSVPRLGTLHYRVPHPGGWTAPGSAEGCQGCGGRFGGGVWRWVAVWPHTTAETTESLALAAPFLLRPELGQAC